MRYSNQELDRKLTDILAEARAIRLTAQCGGLTYLITILGWNGFAGWKRGQILVDQKPKKIIYSMGFSQSK